MHNKKPKSCGGKKNCSCRHILDFHSFHHESVKRNIVEEFANAALKVSSEEHWNTVIALVKITFRNSNYPKKYVDKADVVW